MQMSVYSVNVSERRKEELFERLKEEHTALGADNFAANVGRICMEFAGKARLKCSHDSENNTFRFAPPQVFDSVDWSRVV